MYRYIFVLFVFYFTSHIQAQEFLVDKQLITDFSGTPIYSRLVEEIEGNETWKEEFRYLDDIEMYWITYISDGLRGKRAVS